VNKYDGAGSGGKRVAGRISSNQAKVWRIMTVVENERQTILHENGRCEGASLTWNGRRA